MAQKTNLNATPYYDDFNKDNNYSRILFRPGYAVQARELTQLRTLPSVRSAPPQRRCTGQ